MGREEKSAWKQAALAFLRAAYDLDREAEALSKMRHKVSRLTSFYLAHSCDKQLNALGILGYKHFYPVADDTTPIEHRPMLVENKDSHSVSACKALFF